MLYTIENAYYKATINDMGAELTSLTRKADGYEIIWPGDPAYWTGHAPLLFPFVGKLVDNRYTYQGKTYTMPKHGFASQTVFSVAAQSADSITLVFDDWKRYAEGYPFEYVLSATFALTETGLQFTYSVKNTADTVLYTSFGAHPAINAVDARLEFPCKETIDAYQFGPDGLRKAEKTPFLHDSNSYQILPHTFDHDAFTLDGLKSAYVDVHSAASEHVVRVTFGGAPYVGIWSKSGAPYVCIEPWLGMDDIHGHNGVLTQKEGVQAVQPGQTLDLALEIKVLS